MLTEKQFLDLIKSDYKQPDQFIQIGLWPRLDLDKVFIGKPKNWTCCPLNDFNFLLEKLINLSIRIQIVGYRIQPLFIELLSGKSTQREDSTPVLDLLDKFTWRDIEIGAKLLANSMARVPNSKFNYGWLLRTYLGLESIEISSTQHTVTSSQLNQCCQMADQIFSLDKTINQLIEEKKLHEVNLVENELNLPLAYIRTTGMPFQVDQVDSVGSTKTTSHQSRSRSNLPNLYNYEKEYAKTYRNKTTERIHGNFDQFGTPTGRITIKSPALQSIEKKYSARSKFRVKEGLALVDADYTAMELKILAVIANDQLLLKALQQMDIHRYIASQIFQCPGEQISDDQRQIAKAICYGIVYGAGIKGLFENLAAKQINLPETEVKSLVDRFLTQFSGIRKYQTRNRYLIKKNNSIEARTVMGRTIGGITKYTEALNAPIQGTASDILKLAIVQLFKNRAEVPNAKIVLCVHDEILVECPASIAENVQRWLTKYMKQAMTQVLGHQVFPEVDSWIGIDFWGTPLL